MKAMSPAEKRSFMLETPVNRLIPKMALPTIVAMLITSIYHLADTFFVSKLGTYATGAVGVNGAIDQLIMMAGTLVSMGSSSFVSRLLGAKEDTHGQQVFNTCFFLSFLLGIVVMLAGMLWQDPILRMLGASENLMPYSKDYCRYVLLAAPFLASSFVMNQCLRAEGNATLAMIGMGFGGLLNVALDPLFIFTFGWGVAGASAATALSKLVSWVILIVPYLKKRTLLRLSPKYIHPTWMDTKEVCFMGSAAFFRTGLATLASIVLNKVSILYGESALAAISVANRVTMFLTSACLGFGQGFQPVAGFSWGAGEYPRIREAYRFSQTVCIVGITILGTIVFVLARPILLLFTEDDAELVRIGVICLRAQCLALPVHGFAIIVNMMCVGIGQARGAVLIGLGRQGICFYPILPILTYFFKVWGIACLQGDADLFTFILTIPIARSCMKLIAEREKEAASLAAAPTDTQSAN